MRVPLLRLGLSKFCIVDLRKGRDVALRSEELGPVAMMTEDLEK